MKLTKYPLKKPSIINTEKKRSIMNRSMENIKVSDYTTVQKEDESNLYQIALEEFKDLFPEILLLPKKENGLLKKSMSKSRKLQKQYYSIFWNFYIIK